MTTKQDLIAELRGNRDTRRADLDRIISGAKRANRGLTAGEQSRFDSTESEIRQIDQHISELDERLRADEAAAPMNIRYSSSSNGNVRMETRSALPGATATRSANAIGAAAAAFQRDFIRSAEYRPSLPGQAYERSASISVVSEPEVYREHNPEFSFFADMYNAEHKRDRDAQARIQRNDRMAHERARRAGEVRAISTTNGQGGEFSPPLWLESAFVELARSGRVTADLADVQPLPAGTDLISIPKVNTGTATAIQTVQNSAVQTTDITTTSVSSPVTTISGAQVISLQLLEQSPVSLDKIILEDLARAYATNLDTQVLSGSGTGGQFTGLLTLAGTNSVSWAQTTPALSGAGGLYGAIANGIQMVHSTRFAPADTIIMHPRRWMWIAAQSDLQNRPLVVPSAPINAMGVVGDIVAEGPAGTLLNLPVYLDPNIPTNAGAGTEDKIIITRRSDLRLWEGKLKAETFSQTYAQNLSVLARCYCYSAFIPNRYPQSTAIVSGAGLKAPQF